MALGDSDIDNEGIGDSLRMDGVLTRRQRRGQTQLTSRLLSSSVRNTTRAHDREPVLFQLRDRVRFETVPTESMITAWHASDKILRVLVRAHCARKH